jgi:hypothetical protein
VKYREKKLAQINRETEAAISRIAFALAGLELIRSFNDPTMQRLPLESTAMAGGLDMSPAAGRGAHSSLKSLRSRGRGRGSGDLYSRPHTHRTLASPLANKVAIAIEDGHPAVSAAVEVARNPDVALGVDGAPSSSFGIFARSPYEWATLPSGSNSITGGAGIAMGGSLGHSVPRLRTNT